MNNKGLRAGKADVLCGIVICTVAASMFVHTYSDRYDIDMLFGDVSTVFFPRILLGMIGALSLALAIKGARDKSDERLVSLNWRRVFLTFLAALLTALGVWYLGYEIAMPVGVFLTGLALGYPNKIVLALTSLFASAIVWLALGHFAQVSLPASHLF